MVLEKMVLDQNGIGENGANKMVLSQNGIGENGTRPKWYWRKWYG